MEQFLVKQVLGKDLKVGDIIWDAPTEDSTGGWHTINNKEDDVELMNLECHCDIFLVKLPSPEILIPSEEDIEAWVKEHGYYGACTSEWHEGLEEGAKWTLSLLKELNPNLNFTRKG